MVGRLSAFLKITTLLSVEVPFRHWNVPLNMARKDSHTSNSLKVTVVFCSATEYTLSYLQTL